MTSRENAPGGGGDLGVQAVVAQALELIEDGARVGLGTGRAAAAFITALGARVQQGLVVAAVPTSRDSARLAREVGIPLIDLDEDVMLDLIVDGADEVAPNLDLVKGWGGALVQERIVASASRRQIILVGREKLVAALGERGRIPIEVIPLARGPVTRQLKALGLVAAARHDADGARLLLTENGNLTLDCAVTEPLRDGNAARALEAALIAIVGVVDTGLFLGTAERVLVGYADGRVETFTRSGPRDVTSWSVE
jgi:ribose 5-phosphate isomerase A